MTVRTPYDPFIAVRHVFPDGKGECTRCGLTAVQAVADHISLCPANHEWLINGDLLCSWGLILVCQGQPRLS